MHCGCHIFSYKLMLTLIFTLLDLPTNTTAIAYKIKQDMYIYVTFLLPWLALSLYIAMIMNTGCKYVNNQGDKL